jgi:hypothetical protein
LRSEDALHQYPIGGGPLIELRVDDNVVGAAPDNFLAFDLALRDALLQNVGDEVEALVIFSLCHEDVVAA